MPHPVILRLDSDDPILVEFLLYMRSIACAVYQRGSSASTAEKHAVLDLANSNFCIRLNEYVAVAGNLECTK